MSLRQQNFWFLRHGETDWNTKFLAQGDVDIPLNATGLQQAHDAAQRLQNRGIAHVIASPLSRAHDTARITADLLGLTVEIDEGLREVSFGEHEGVVMTEWFTDWVEGRFTPPRGETFVDLRARARMAINRALERDGPVLIVAHGALFRAVRAEMGLEPNVRTPNATPYYCVPGSPCWELSAAM